MVNHDDDVNQARFLNVDLDVFSRENLGPLVKGLGKSFFVLHEGRWGRKYAAILELEGSHYGQKKADLVIRRMVVLLNKMPDSARHIWNRAQVRRFNIGIQAALRPHSFELQVGQRSLQSIARLGADLVITVYAPEGSKRKGIPRAKKCGSRPTTD